jgi:hypothetical protein
VLSSTVSQLSGILPLSIHPSFLPSIQRPTQAHPLYETNLPNFSLHTFPALGLGTHQHRLQTDTPDFRHQLQLDTAEGCEHRCHMRNVEEVVEVPLRRPYRRARLRSQMLEERRRRSRRLNGCCEKRKVELCLKGGVKVSLLFSSYHCIMFMV